MIIAAFSGVGKTTLAKLFPDKVIDFTCMPYKYNLDENKAYTEADKADPEMEFIIGWQERYVEAIKQNMSDDKILLIPSDFTTLELLKEEGISYTLCYPQRKAKRVYHKRFKKRGNSKDFIDIFIGRWDRFIDSLEEDTYGHHIVLKPKQFLSDVIDVDALLKDSPKQESNGLFTIPDEVARLIPIDQLKMTTENPLEFQDGIELLKNQLQKCPNLYETDNMEEHPAIFHYFCGGTDIYICEYDKNNEMFGYSILNGDLDNSEWGYIALSELTKIPPLNIDYHFEEQTVEAALFNQYPKYFKKPKSLK